MRKNKSLNQKHYNLKQEPDSYEYNVKPPCIKRNPRYVKLFINTQIPKQSKLIRHLSKFEFNKNAQM